MLTINELRDALAWAQEHSQNKHADEPAYGRFVFRHVSRGGIGSRAIVMCEACDSIPGKGGNAENYQDVTDYDAW